MTDVKNDIQYQGRIIISIKDVEIIYDCHRTTAWRKIEKIKEHFAKPRNGDITIFDFSAFTGIPLENVIQCMRR